MSEVSVESDEEINFYFLINHYIYIELMIKHMYIFFNRLCS